MNKKVIYYLLIIIAIIGLTISYDYKFVREYFFLGGWQTLGGVLKDLKEIDNATSTPIASRSEFGDFLSSDYIRYTRINTYCIITILSSIGIIVFSIIKLTQKGVSQTFIRNDLTNEQIINKSSNEDKCELLRTLIINEKKIFLAKSKKDDIQTLLTEIIKDISSGVEVLKIYEEKYHSDMIADLSDLTSSYEGKKQILSKFIEFEIVSAEFPHDRKNAKI